MHDPWVGRLGKQEGKAFLVGSYISSKEKEECQEHLRELSSLCDTYGFKIAETLPCHVQKISAATFLGTGKIEEIAAIARETNVDIIIFDDEISPQQQRNLEKALQKPVIDRTELILGVFAKRAKTREAQIQIDLARCKYQLPRLRRMWTHLGRQRIKGGSGGYLKGAGEKQIEIDRRVLKNSIAQLTKELEEVKQHRSTQRHLREKSHIPTFAIIGYTNAGKSTLLNALTDAKVLVEDKLFATLDTTTRKFSLPNKQEILLIDTVGFIRKIPHTLVASFKSTLEEACHADILLHLIDVSNKEAKQQTETTYEVLKELNALNHPIITCLNKIDKCENRSICLYLKLKYPKTVEISALKKEGLDQLFDLMMEEISRLRKVIKLRVPQSHYALVSKIIKQGRIIVCDYEGNDVILEAEIPHTLEHELLKYVVG